MRAGSGSHLDVERRTVRVPRSLVMVLSEKSISLDRVTWRERLLSLDDGEEEEISRHRSNFSSIRNSQIFNVRDFLPAARNENLKDSSAPKH